MCSFRSGIPVRLARQEESTQAQDYVSTLTLEGRGRAARTVDLAVGTNQSVVVPEALTEKSAVTTLVAGTLIHRLV